MRISSAIGVMLSRLGAGPFLKGGRVWHQSNLVEWYMLWTSLDNKSHHLLHDKPIVLKKNIYCTCQNLFDQLIEQPEQK